MQRGALRAFGHQSSRPRQLALSSSGAPSFALRFVTGKAANSSGDGKPLSDNLGDDETVVITAEEDPVEVLRRIQAENAAKAAALRDKAPPTPPRHSGKTRFFEEDTKADGATPTEGVETARSAVERPATSQTRTPSRPVGRVLPRSGTAFSSSAAMASGPLAGRKTTASASAAAAAAKKDGGAGNPFMAKLDKMDAESKSPAFPTFDAAAEKRRHLLEEKLKEERKQLLVFRDVGMDLDKPILSRDIFLVFKYFRFGTEFAVDNELERQLRYFNEHAVNELKIIQDSKLMRGPPTLSKKRHTTPKRSVFSAPGGGVGVGAASTAAGGVIGPEQRSQTPNLTSSNWAGAAPFQVTSSFPHVRCANMLQYCVPFDDQRRATVQGLLRPSAAQSAFAQFLLGRDKAAAGTRQTPAKFDARSDAQMTTLSPASFRRPAVVIYSQMGQKFGTECDEAWRRLAYSTICPAVVPYLASAAAPLATPNTPTTAPALAAHHKSSPIDVISLRSADLYKYRWVHALYVRRLAKTLADTTGSVNASRHDKGDADADAETRAGARKLLTAATTFVGPRLLEPFYATMGLRNYLLPQVMLVDHEGVVRWLSGGLPDAYETEHFPALLRQLETEFYSTKRAT